MVYAKSFKSRLVSETLVTTSLWRKKNSIQYIEFCGKLLFTTPLRSCATKAKEGKMFRKDTIRNILTNLIFHSIIILSTFDN